MYYFQDIALWKQQKRTNSKDTLIQWFGCHNPTIQAAVCDTGLFIATAMYSIRCGAACERKNLRYVFLKHSTKVIASRVLSLAFLWQWNKNNKLPLRSNLQLSQGLNWALDPDQKFTKLESDATLSTESSWNLQIRQPTNAWAALLQLLFRIVKNHFRIRENA